MKTLFFFLICQAINTCSKNCFLGGMFFSAPLDEQQCCLENLRGNCDRFIQINANKFLCEACQTGYKWFDNECIEIDSQENCVNPEVKTYPFHECQICRFEEDRRFVPIYQDGEYRCLDYNNSQVHKFVHNRLNNCEQTGADGQEIFCYKCLSGYFQNWKTQSCEESPENTNSPVYGCSITMDMQTCEVCYPDFQMNPLTRKCVERSVDVANEIFNQQQTNFKDIVQQSPQFQQQMNSFNQMAQNFRDVAQNISQMQGYQINQNQNQLFHFLKEKKFCFF